MEMFNKETFSDNQEVVQVYKKVTRQLKEDINTFGKNLYQIDTLTTEQKQAIKDYSKKYAERFFDQPHPDKNVRWKNRFNILNNYPNWLLNHLFNDSEKEFVYNDKVNNEFMMIFGKIDKYKNDVKQKLEEIE